MDIIQSYGDLTDAVELEREAQARMHRAAGRYLDLWGRGAMMPFILSPAKTEALIYGLGLKSPEDLAALINERAQLPADYEAYVRHGRRTGDLDFIDVRVKAAAL